MKRRRVVVPPLSFPRRKFCVMVTNHSSLWFGYLAGRYPGSLGHLYSPGGQRGPWHFLPYALDNGAYSAFRRQAAWDEGAWFDLLSWAVDRPLKPLWAVVPDVVGDREATLARWRAYLRHVVRRGFTPAFAVQDGMTFRDVPTDDCVLFIGGSTEWKVRSIAPWCSQFPGRVHVARVNDHVRLRHCLEAGAVSVDGTGWHHTKFGQLRRLVHFVSEGRE